MSLMAERTGIVTKFMSAWNSDKTPVKFDGMSKLVKGKGEAADETKLDEWCHLSVMPSDAVRGDISDVKMVRYTGNIIVNVFVKLGTKFDPDRPLELATNALEILQLSEIGDVITRSAVVTNMGQRDGSSFYQMSVRVPYYRDQYFTK